MVGTTKKGIEKVNSDICGFFSEMQDIRKKISGIQNAIRKGENSWLEKTSYGPDLDSIATKLDDLTKRVSTYATDVEAQHNAALTRYDQKVIRLAELEKELEVVKNLLDLIGRGRSPEEIENKMCKFFRGDFRWRAYLDSELTVAVHNFLAAATETEREALKKGLIDSLNERKKAIEPEDTEKSKGVLCLEENKKSRDSLRSEISIYSVFLARLAELLAQIDVQKARYKKVAF